MWIAAELRAEDRAGPAIAAGDIYRAGGFVYGGRAPDAGALAAGRHGVEGGLPGAGGGVELDQLALHQRAVVERRHPDVDAAVIDGGRAPDQVIGRGAQPGAPEDLSGQRVERDHRSVGVDTGDGGAGGVPVATTAHVEDGARRSTDGLVCDRRGRNDAGDRPWRRRLGDRIGEVAVLGAAQV